MLANEPVVLPHFGGNIHSWRITWERLQDHLQNAKSEQISRMSQAPVNAQAAEDFAKTGGIMPGTVFVDFVQEELAANIKGYNGFNGFDLDLFLVVQIDAEAQTAVATVHNEIFPRQHHSVVQTNFGSGISLPKAPWVEMNDPDGKPEHALQGILFKERMDRGEDASQLYRTFSRFQGMWEITTRQWVDVFLNRLFFTIMSAGMEGTPEALAGNVRYVESEAFKASFYRSLAKP